MERSSRYRGNLGNNNRRVYPDLPVDLPTNCIKTGRSTSPGCSARYANEFADFLEGDQ